ncbi:3-oxoacyl-[acyl-carrier-protein] reductase [Floricoccus tropicus]|uniref:3-oxoacyl-[acyl-carrier-protein] reductase n=1 Tax=Floricoccus tropicus TaxID=1859473 RepID=A0A1E8GQ75_9LACT|nr:3-oxoacyl-[acyl-carrier-protein] reductase [Floricoccus tropicus]OFI50410.1 3-oxoacyl-[acyl-carrier-protein] reductase [Floricoccus tropicus]
MDLKDKTVLVTGSSRGIGLAIAKKFAQEGANIILNGRSEISENLINEIAANGVKCIAATGDISSFEDVANMLKKVEEQLGTIDILINNAGITKDSLFLRMKASDFDDVISTNLTGTFNVSQQIFKKMMKQRYGVIINLSSVSAQLGNLGQANYAASKAGIIGMSKSMAREGASRNVRSNTIAPGFIETEMTDILSDNVKEQIKATIPLNRFGSVDDVAELAVFLAKSPYITGQVINVDGGMVMNG